MAAITPSVVYNLGPIGMATLMRADFAGTADDGDTWASGLAGQILGYIVQDTDNPTTQASVGVAAVLTVSTGGFTFYPAEDNKSFSLYFLRSGS